jgi:hypothetical protein
METVRSLHDLFKVRIDTIYKAGGKHSDQCKKEIGNFLYRINEWKTFGELWELYQGIIKVHDPAREKQIKELESVPNKSKFVYTIEKKMDDMVLQGFYFGQHGITSYDETGRPIGTLINQPIQVDLKNHRQAFYKLFPYRFKYIDPSQKDEFLKYQLRETFKDDSKLFRQFLNEIKASSREVIGDHLDYLNQWIEDIANQNKRNMSAKQHAIILFVKYSSGEYILTNKTKQLAEYANDAGIAEKSFRQTFYEIQTLFSKESIPKRIKVLEEILPVLTSQADTNWVKSHIKQLKQSK